MPSVIDWLVKRICDLTRTATDANLTDNEYLAVDDASNPYTRKITVASLAAWIHKKWIAFVNALTAKTSFVSGDKIPVVNGSTATAMEASKLLELTAQNVMSLNDKLYGKKWYACGDSYTAGLSASSGVITDEGFYKGYRAVYPYYVGNRTGMDVHNIAVGAMTLAYKNNYSDAGNCFSFSDTGLYLSIPSDADYVTLKFGINDFYQSIPIGSIDDDDNTTIYGAWNIVMEQIRSTCPRAKIGIIVTNRAGELTSKAGRDIAVKWGVPYLDENFDPKIPLLNDVTGKPYVSDNVKDIVNSAFRISSSNIHPNDFAHWYESTIVENFLRSL